MLVSQVCRCSQLQSSMLDGGNSTRLRMDELPCSRGSLQAMSARWNGGRVRCKSVDESAYVAARPCGRRAATCSGLCLHRTKQSFEECWHHDVHVVQHCVCCWMIGVTALIDPALILLFSIHPDVPLTSGETVFKISIYMCSRILKCQQVSACWHFFRFKLTVFEIFGEFDSLVDKTLLLPPPRRICNCCLSVCLFVSNFVQKLVNGFAWNFQGRLAVGHWTNY